MERERASREGRPEACQQDACPYLKRLDAGRVEPETCPDCGSTRPTVVNGEGTTLPPGTRRPRTTHAGDAMRLPPVEQT